MIARVAERVHVGITCLGAYVPEQVPMNHDLARMVETSDEWITMRTGSRERELPTSGSLSR